MTDTVEAFSREELRRRFAQAANEADLNTIDAIVTVVQREVLPKVVQAACDGHARLLRMTEDELNQVRQRAEAAERETNRLAELYNSERMRASRLAKKLAEADMSKNVIRGACDDYARLLRATENDLRRARQRAEAAERELEQLRGLYASAAIRANRAAQDTRERVATLEERLRKAEQEHEALLERAEEAERTIARLTAERDRLRAELADVHHDLRLCVGSDYSTAASAAAEACRRVAAAETELRRLRAELKTPPEDRHALRARAAEALRDWHARRVVVCEHTQIIDYGAAADAVLAALDGRSPEPANKEGDQ